jgi:MFS family permease
MPQRVPPPSNSSAADRALSRSGWINLFVASLAMVATLPGRTQGLGLITEGLMEDLRIDRVRYADLNFWATLGGAAFCLGSGRLMDRFGPRAVLVALSLMLGATVCFMSAIHSVAMLAVALLLTRGLGQSALSATSISLVGLWFHRRLEKAMAVYSIVLSMGFMAVFPLVGAVVARSGWRVAWLGIGIAVLLLAPVAILFVRRPPERIDEADTPEASAADTDFTLAQALATPAFWVFSVSSAVYLLVASGIGLFNESVLLELGFPAGLYHKTLAVTALTALAGNFLGGWLAGRHSPGALMAVAMGLLAGGLVALPHLTTEAAVYAQAVVMGIAGGFVTVLFFTFWRKVYGRTHLGLIQGAAQMMTVLASALGPMVLARCHAATGSYAFIFRLLAGATLALAVMALLVRLPKWTAPKTA